jgi:hypothetical protein
MQYRLKVWVTTKSMGDCFLLTQSAVLQNSMAVKSSNELFVRKEKQEIQNYLKKRWELFVYQTVTCFR